MSASEMRCNTTGSFRTPEPSRAVNPPSSTLRPMPPAHLLVIMNTFSGILLTVFVTSAAFADDNIRSVTARGDIRRTAPPAPDASWVPLYQGNGRFGCCYGPSGLHLNPGVQSVFALRGQTHFTHLRHWIRGRYNADYLLPVARIYWSEEPRFASDYEQHQSFHDGTVRTRFASDTFSATVTTWFDPVHRDIAGFRIEVAGNAPPVVIAPPRQLSLHYEQKLQASCEGRISGQIWRGKVRCLDRTTDMAVQSSAVLKEHPAGVQVSLKPGRNDIVVNVGSDPSELPAAQESLDATIKWWHDKWNASGWLDLPDDDAQKVWVRTLAYTLYSHNDDGFGCSPPTGVSGGGWPFPFPFDSGCRQPLLLWTGQLDEARKWVEFWASDVEGMRAYTKRIWHVDGMMLPHVFPFGSFKDYHTPEAPNENYYPIYLAGHMVRIADQTAAMVNDPKWTARFAHPLIRGAAEFYHSIAKLGDDRLWHFTVIPSLGLDESGGLNQPDYYSTFVSAEYSFKKAIEHGLDTDGSMQKILRDGIAYPALLAKQGMYYSNAGSGARDFGRQKHPDQLAPLVHLPVSSRPSEPLALSYRKRYEITADASQPRFAGQTLGEFILASARMRDVDGWRKDWSMVQPARYTDPDWIQFVESSGSNLTYYVTTHGMFGQAILEAVVSTWWGPLDIGACIPWSGQVRFGNIRTPLGVTVSGSLRDGRGEARLRAWRPATFDCRGQTIRMDAGQVKNIELR